MPSITDVNLRRMNHQTFWAFTAGKGLAYREDHLFRARKADSDELKRIHVEHARYWHRRYLTALRRAFR